MARTQAPHGQFLSLLAMALSALTLFAALSVAPAYGQGTTSAQPYGQGATSTTSAPVAIGPTSATSTSSATIKISVDTPAPGQTVKGGDQISFGGWAVDNTGGGGVIETVVIFENGHPGEGGVRVGEAEYGISRPDVAALLGNPAYTLVGFDLNWRVAGEAGPRTLYVYAYSSTHGWGYQAITLNVDGATAMPGSPSPSSASSSQGAANQSTTSPYTTTTGAGYTGQTSQVGSPYNQGYGQGYGATGQGYGATGTNPYGAAANTGYGNQVGAQYGNQNPYGIANTNPNGYGYAGASPYLSNSQQYGNQNPYSNASQYPGAGTNPYGSGYPGGSPYIQQGSPNQYQGY